MRLVDLNPKLEGDTTLGVLTFDCPLGHGHRMRVLIHAAPYGEIHGIKHWQASGAFPDSLTLTPSIDTTEARCWHGNITNGALA